MLSIVCALRSQRELTCKKWRAPKRPSLSFINKKITLFSLPAAAFSALALEKRLWQSFVSLEDLLFDMVVFASYARYMHPTAATTYTGYYTASTCKYSRLGTQNSLTSSWLITEAQSNMLRTTLRCRPYKPATSLLGVL